MILGVGGRHIICMWHARLDLAIRWQMTMLLFTKNVASGGYPQAKVLGAAGLLSRLDHSFHLLMQVYP